MQTHSRPSRFLGTSTALTHLVFGALLGVLTPPLFADVIVVDGDGAPGSDFTDLTTAVFAAADGDTLIVDGGGPLDVYGSFFVVGKSLNVIGRADASGARPRVVGVVDVRSLPAGEHFVMRGFDVVSNDPAFYAVQLLDNSGTVFLEDLALRMPGVVAGEFQGRPPLAIFECRGVHLVRIDAAGPHGTASAAGGPGMQIVNSQVAIHGCNFHGGDGAAAQPSSNGTNGGAALRQFDSEVLIEGSLFEGGAGGAGLSTGSGCFGGGLGGNALEVFVQVAPSSTVWHVSSTFLGGATAGSVACPAGDPVAPIATAGGTVSALPGQAPSLASPVLVEFGSSFELAIAGPPSAFAFVGVSPVPRHHPALSLAGVLAIEPRFGIVEVGQLSATGAGSLVGSVRDFGAATVGIVVQVATADVATGLVTLGAPTVVTFLAP
jgi:hypothetical protein